MSVQKVSRLATASRKRAGCSDALELLKDRFAMLHSMSNERARGPLLAQFLDDLVELFDMQSLLVYEPDENYIGGSLELDSVDRAFRAIWTESGAERSRIDEFGSSPREQDEAPLGIFLSINGFSGDALDAFKDDSAYVAADGADIFLVLDQRVRLDELFRHKIQIAEQLGKFFLGAREMIIE